MNYIIFDLELNSKMYKSKLPNEIIEIGAVKLSNELEVIDSFQSFVRPKVHKKLFSVIKRKTHISQVDVNNADSFRNVQDSFKRWIGEESFILCSWGHDDLHHLKANCRFNHVGCGWCKLHMDIQKKFSRMHDVPKGQAFSLKNALALMGIPVKEELHRADVDARYTAELFIRMSSMPQ